MLIESNESKRAKDGQGRKNSYKDGLLELDQACQSNQEEDAKSQEVSLA